MWALRRVSNPLRSRGLSIRGSTPAFSDPELLITRNQDSDVKYPELGSDKQFSFMGFYRRKHASSDFFTVRRGLSSQAGAKDGGEEDYSEDGLSQEVNEDDYDNGELPKGELPKGEIDISDIEADSVESAPSRRRVVASLVNAMIMTRGASIHGALEKWVAEGNNLGHSEINLAMANLRKLRMYGRALQFSQWLESSKRLEFAEKDYSNHLDLIAKVQGIPKAEHYIEKIPQSFRVELIYRTFLANCVSVGNGSKAEEVFNKIRDLKFPLTTFVCNQLILLYKRTDKKKVADVILLMENENLKPNLFTYRLLIDLKVRFNDTLAIEAILETMKAEGIEQDLATKSMLVRHYISAGLREKAEAILREIEEGSESRETRPSRRVLLEHYADLGDSDEVTRIWRLCEEDPSPGEFLAAVGAWGKLKNIEKAEAAFEGMMKAVKKPSSIHYNALLTVYADNKMLEKGKSLVKRMAEDDVRVGPLTLDSLLRLYVEAGLAEKADEILMKFSRVNHSRPLLFRSFIGIMGWYADRGDVHNTEKMFRRMREAGYTSRANQFQTLVRAYVNAKQPAYGMRERMKADNLFPNKALAAQLAKIDSLRQTPDSYLLD